MSLEIKRCRSEKKRKRLFTTKEVNFSRDAVASDRVQSKAQVLQDRDEHRAALCCVPETHLLAPDF